MLAEGGYEVIDRALERFDEPPSIAAAGCAGGSAAEGPPQDSDRLIRVRYVPVAEADRALAA